MDTKSYTTIREIVSESFISEGDFTAKGYMQRASIVIRGIRHLQLHTLKQIKTVMLPISAINTVDMPEDYIKYIRVGLNADERVYTLTYNPNIVLLNETLCGADDRDITASNDNVLVLPYNSTPFNGNTYGLSGGYNCYFREDKEHGRLVLEGEMPADADILLEYLSSGISISEDTQIPIIAYEALLAWLYWKLDKENPRLMNLFGIEETKLKNFIHSFTLSELLDAGYLGSAQSIKR
jgi:hypothetical protein